MKIMHISDIHFNYKNFKSNILRSRLLSYIENNDIKVDSIIITGDCIYKYGKTDECENFINELRQRTGCKKRNMFMCPGNHDIDRDNGARTGLIKDIRNKKMEDKVRVDLTDQLVEQLTNVGYDRFSALHQTITGRRYKSFNVTKRDEEQKCRIVNIDTCLLSNDDYDKGELRVCCTELERLEKDIKNDEYVNILIMHHGIEYFDEEDILPFQHWISDNHIDIVLCGHSHRGGIRTYDETKMEIKQFVCGATMLDNYTIPSFLIYDIHEKDIEVYNYYFSKNEWELGSSHLRAFKNGVYSYKVKRIHHLKQKESYNKGPISTGVKFNKNEKSNLDKLNEARIGFLRELDNKFFLNYGQKVFSTKYNCWEDFSCEKIVSSLLKIDLPLSNAFEIVELVVNDITSKEFKSNNIRDMTTEYIRDYVYAAICRMPCDNEDVFIINEWAGKYARKYGHSKHKLIIYGKNGEENEISIKFINDTIVKDMFFRATGNNDCYESLPRTEIANISLSILDFLKECDVYTLSYEYLIDFLIEMASREPHPYIVTDKNRDKVLQYHRDRLLSHLKKLEDKKAEHITLLETLYHSSALLISMYANVTGYSEISPIAILHQSILNMGADKSKTPIPKLNMVDLKKDIGNIGESWSDFVYLIYDICNSDIMKRVFVSQEHKIVPFIIKLGGLSLKMHDNYINRGMIHEDKMLDYLSAVLSNGIGFVVKNPLENPRNCFWLSTNWKEEEIHEYGFKKQVFVVVAKNIEKNIEQVKSYLSKKINFCGETIWVKDDGKIFTKNQMNNISQNMNSLGINTYFINKAIIDSWVKSDVREELYGLMTK